MIYGALAIHYIKAEPNMGYVHLLAASHEKRFLATRPGMVHVGSSRDKSELTGIIHFHFRITAAAAILPPCMPQ